MNVIDHVKCSFNCFLFSYQVWDVISNQEAVKIVASTPNREKAAQKLVKCATHEWKRKRRGIAIDDISAICLFFHSPPPSDDHQLSTTKVVE